MIRNLKALGLALVAMFAMSALTAAGASAAADFSAASYPTTVTGVQDSASQVFSTTAGTLTCNKVTGQGVLAAESSSLTATNIDYSECARHGGGNFDPVFNGCDYVFNAGNTTSPTTSTGTADIECPAGKSIEIGIPFICLIKITTQTGLGPVTYHNIANGDVTVDAEIENKIKSSHSGIVCGSGNDNTGDYFGKITVAGENAGGAPVNIAITNT